MLPIVPYQGNGHGRRQQGGSALAFPEVASMPFAAWMRGGGRARTAPVGGPGDVECEKQGLLEDHISFVTLMDATNKRARCTTVATVTTLMVATLVLIGLGLSVLKINQSLGHLEAALAPNVNKVTNLTMGMLQDARNSISHVEHAAGEGDEVATKAAPNMVAIVNSSAELAKRLGHLLSHPVLQLSLTDVQSSG